MQSIIPSNTSELEALVEKYSPFFKEVKKRIISTFLVFLISTLAGIVFYEDIIKFLIDVLELEGINLVFTSPFQFINLAISCGIAVGLIMVSPLLITQILYFVKPALNRKEFKKIVGLLPLSIFLFVAGFLFGAFIMKWQIQIFASKSISLNIGNVLDISHLLSTILLTSAFMGLGFQFPIILLLLMFTGVLSHQHLSKLRLWIYLGSFIFAILLPADTILADILLAMPFIILFEFTLFYRRLSYNKS